MRIVAVAGLLFVACSPQATEYPIGGGGGGGTGGTGGGSSGSGIDANPDVIEGLVCVMPDPRDFATCLGSGAGGIAVNVGTQSAVTADDGSFTINTPIGSSLLWTVSGSNVMTSTIGFSTSAVIPALELQTFEDLMSSNGIVYDPTQGTIIGQVLHSGSGDPAVTALATPAGIYQTYYASTNDVQDWMDAAATTAFGTFLIGGLTPGSETLTLQPGAGSATIVDGVASGSGTVTFLTTGL